MKYNKKDLELILGNYLYIGDLDIGYAIDDLEEYNREELATAIEELIRQEEVIYYANAIEILKEDDPSLQESLGLADDYGYNLRDINSELLATLLQQDLMLSELDNLLDDLEDLLLN